MRLAAIISAFVCVLSSAMAEGTNFNVAGAGASTCAQFAQAYATSPDGAEPLYFTWAQGFMSGLNTSAIARKTPSKDLASEPVAEQEAAIRDYCDKHPLQEYWEAAFALYLSLKTDAK